MPFSDLPPAQAAYCAAVLSRELAHADYDGMTVDAAWAWLTQPAVTTVTRPTAVRITPLVASGVIGPVKADALAGRVKATLPAIADSLMAVGVLAADPGTQAFLDQLVGPPIDQADIDALKALGAETVTVTAPPRLAARFDPARWPHVAADGSAGTPDDPAVNGFPNALARPDFDAAWTAAGRPA